MIREMSKKEFEERFPNVSTYGLNLFNVVYLDNGEYLLDTEWNGETYIVLDSGKEYRPVYKKIDEDDFEIIGYEEM